LTIDNEKAEELDLKEILEAGIHQRKLEKN
jgi:hypothetical protein